jgi:hypothetical protein
MAISSLINPTGFPSCQDALWHIALSDNSGQTDMKYVFDVFNGSTQLVRVKVYPEPTNGRGYFDASRVVKNEITYDWFVPERIGGDAMNLVYSNTLNQTTYNIRVGEDVSGITTLNMASGNITAYNYTPPMLKRRQFGIDQKYNNWLTNRPLTIKAGLNDKILIPLFENDHLFFSIQTYNQNNTLITSWDEDVSETFTWRQCDVGANAINNQYGGSLINSNVKYYKVKLKNGSFYGDTIVVNLECDPRYTTMNLYFINHFGMFDTARFNLSQKKMMSIERKSYQQKEYDFNTTSVDYYNANNVYNESKINYNSKSNWSYKLTMNYPTDQEYEWLAELIDSPQIFAEIDGDYYPVTLKTTSYEYMKYQNDGLKEFSIEIEMNQTRFGFRR